MSKWEIVMSIFWILLLGIMIGFWGKILIDTHLEKKNSYHSEYNSIYVTQPAVKEK